jgi:acetylornithine deacetylase
MWEDAMRGPSDHRGDGCLIPEPYNDGVVVAQVGVLWCRVNVRGSAGHVSGARRSVNAIEKTYVLIQAMRALEERLNSRRHAAFADNPWPINFNVGIIRGGDWPSTVPAAARVRAVSQAVSFTPSLRYD